MPPKKSKKGSIASKEKRSAKCNPVDELTFKEAALIYQVQLKKEQLNSRAIEIDALCRKKTEQTEKNQMLALKRDRLVSDVASKRREEEDKADRSCPQLKFNELEDAVNETLEVNEAEEKKLTELKEEIRRIKKKISDERRQIEARIVFKDAGVLFNENRICSLKNELGAMNQSYSVLSRHLQGDIEKLRQGFESYIAVNIEEQKQYAGQKALQSLDSKSQQEALSNHLLREEIDILKVHYQQELSTAEELEQDNLDILGELFDYQLEDLQTAKRFHNDCSLADQAVDELRSHSCSKECTTDGDADSIGVSLADLKFLCVVGKQTRLHDCDRTDLAIDNPQLSPEATSYSI